MNDSHLIPPCHTFYDEYKDCSGQTARMKQLYFDRQYRKCGEYMDNFHLCLDWDKRKDEQALKTLISIEQGKKKKFIENNVNVKSFEIMNRRKNPPNDWDISSK
ncbi:hypothetical protein SNEBB_002172 [Seison nebaliae]|nr:hypothetical protein SNEBB_002172 [Seison nebaliae]